MTIETDRWATTYAAYHTNYQVFKSLPSRTDTMALQHMSELIKETPNAKLFLGFTTEHNGLKGYLDPKGNRASRGIVWEAEGVQATQHDCACKGKAHAAAQIERLPVHTRPDPDRSIVHRAAVHATAAEAIGELQRTIVDSGDVRASREQVDDFFARQSKPLTKELAESVFQILRKQADPSLSTLTELHFVRRADLQQLPTRYKISVAARGAPEYEQVEDETDGYQGNAFLISDYLNEHGLDTEDAEWLVNSSQHSLTAHLYGELEKKFEEKISAAKALEKKIKAIAREMKPEYLLAGDVDKPRLEYLLDVVMKHSLAAVALFLAYLRVVTPHLDGWASDFRDRFGTLSKSGDDLLLGGTVQFSIGLAKPEIANLLVGDLWSRSVNISLLK